MGLQHPEVTKIMQTGYPSWNQEPDVVGFDSMGNEIYAGEVIYELDDCTFVAEELSFESRRILEKLGATREIAQ